MEMKLGVGCALASTSFVVAAMLASIANADPMRDLRTQRNVVLPEIVMQQRDMQLQRETQLRTSASPAEQLKLQKDLMQRNEQLKTTQPSSPAIHRVTQTETVRVEPENKLSEMSRQLDLLDQKEFKLSLDRASECMRRENWHCADGQLQQARKLARSPQEQKMLRQTENALLNEKMRAQNRSGYPR